jgi:hypothetical protein
LFAVSSSASCSAPRATCSAVDVFKVAFHDGQRFVERQIDAVIPSGGLAGSCRCGCDLRSPMPIATYASPHLGGALRTVFSWTRRQRNKRLRLVAFNNWLRPSWHSATMPVGDR